MTAIWKLKSESINKNSTVDSAKNLQTDVIFSVERVTLTKVLCPELFPVFGIYFLLVLGEFVCWCSWHVVWYFVVITGTVNDVNNSSVIYRTSSNVSFASPVKLWKLDMSPLCSKQSICKVLYLYFSVVNQCFCSVRVSSKLCEHDMLQIA